MKFGVEGNYHCLSRVEGERFFMWNSAEHTDQENLRWSLLRAIEWGVWRAFLSGPVGPFLLLFMAWWKLVLLVGALTIVWAFVRYRFVNLFGAWLGCLWRQLSFVAVPVAVWLLVLRRDYLLACLALGWPFCTALFGLIVGGTQVGRIQEMFMRKLGYSKSDFHYKK